MNSQAAPQPASRLGPGFIDLALAPEIARAIAEMGFVEPTEIQARVIPVLLDGRDVIGQAQTGTGKTAAFGIPLIEGIEEYLPFPQALVLAPTRELALQISEELRKIARYIPGIKLVTLYGGAGYGRQFEDLKAGAQVVVGTPGRVLDHIGRGTLKLDEVDYLVLDEADRMLDMGFLPDVERILRRTPRERQTALFSATMPTVIRILSRRYMQDPTSVHVQPQQITVEEVEQVYYEVADRDKVEGLLSLIQHDPPERAMIFRQTKLGVDRLEANLRRRGVSVAAIHGDMSQNIRERVLADFREGKLTYLIATDVAARGLDIPEVSHVFNYDIPEDPEAYVHRIGRTARAGRSGKAVTFVGEWDGEKLPPIQKLVGALLERKLLPIYERS
ncbi:MAG: DEAD/DEAH box helicase [Chloroflexi bacterium]|nr:DEAD/DEAH box helicase [Chloroflexota bacterium]